MRTALKSFLLIAVMVIVTGMMKCTISTENPSDDRCGGGGTGSECGIFGLLQETSGNPAQNIPVTLRPREYLAFQGSLGKRIINEHGYTIYTTTTDNKGFYSFKKEDSIPAGVYCIEARDFKSGNCLFIDSIVIDSQLLKSDTGLEIRSPYVKTDNTLRQPGSITGIIQLTDSSDGGSMFVYGLNASAEIQPDGSFKIENLPAGNLRLQVVPVHNANEHINTLTVTTIAGLPTVLDTMYGIFYDGNGNTCGSVTSVNNLFSAGDTVIIPGNSDTLEKTGFVFAGWNTTADGSGDWYDPGDTLIIGTAAKVLYAQWAATRHLLTVTSNGNGNVNGSDSVVHGVPHALTAIPDSGYHLSAWRVTSGKATIADSLASSTTVILDRGDATVEGVFSTSVTFIKTFERTGVDLSPYYHYNHYSRSAQQTTDGGYIFCVAILTDSSTDLIKTTSTGVILWTKKFKVILRDFSSTVLHQTIDGGYILIGETAFFADAPNVYLIKTTASGDTLWTKRHGKINSDLGYSVQQTDDGGYIIAGRTDSPEALYPNVYLIKTAATGDTLWTKSYGGEDSREWGAAVQQTTDGGYIIAGYEESSRGALVYLLKTTSTGDTLWTQSYGGPNWNSGNSVQQTNDGGYIIAGETASFGAGGADVYLIKTTSTGDTLWTKTYGGTFDDFGRSVQQTTDGGYIIAGDISTLTGTDVYLIKTTSSGDTMWTRTYGGTDDDYGSSVQQTTDGGYIISGQINGDACLIKTDENGNVE